MTTGHTFYRPIDEIDLPEFKHLKDGRPVLARENGSFCVVSFKDAGYGHYFWIDSNRYVWRPTHFSTHDPRSIGNFVVPTEETMREFPELFDGREVRAYLHGEVISVRRGPNGGWIEQITGKFVGVAAIEVPIHEPLKIEVTND